MKKALLGSSNGIRLALAVGAISLLASQQAAATNLFWSGNGTTQGGAGTWTTTVARFGSVAAGPYGTIWNNANIDSAEFGGTSGQVNLAGPLTVNLITTDLAGFNIGNANSAAAVNRIDFQGANAGVFTNYAGGTTTLSALLTANNVVTKTGAGRMEMGNGSNPNTVKYILKGGVMTTASIARMSGTAPAALVQDFLTFDGGGWAINTGSQTTGNRGITILSGGANFGTSSNTISITVDQPIAGSQGGGLNVTNAGPFSSANTSNGGGQLILTAQNTYDGVTTITSTASKLSVSTLGNGSQAASSLGISSSAASNLVLNGGTLAYIGTVAGSTDRNFTITATGGSLDASGTVAAATATYASTAAIALSGTGTRTLTLTGTNTGGNLLQGALGNQGANATSVTKTGAGTWIMDNGANSYTGPTTITLGTLLAGHNSAFGASKVILNGGVLGTSGGARTLANATDLAVASTLQPTNNLDFSGSFTVISGLTRVLASNTATGTTTFSGNLYLSDSAITAGTLTLAGVATSLPVYTVSGTISNFNGSGLAGNIQIGNGSAATAATLNLTGTNTHSGETRVSTQSLLNIGSAGALGASTLSATGNGSFDNTAGVDLNLPARDLNLTAGSPTYVGSANNLSLGNVQIIAANRSITVTAKTLSVNNIAPDSTPTRQLTKGGAGKLVVRGAGSYTGATVIAGGTLQLGDGGTTGSLSTSSAINFTLGAGNLTFNRSNSLTQGIDFSGAAITQTTGVGSLTQAGGASSILTLTAANTYGGGTTVQSGTLLANNTSGSATGTGGVTVNSGATFGGTGSISGAVTVDGTLSPGASIESLATGAVTFGATGTYLYEMQTNQPPAVAGDLLDVNGALNITTGAALSLAELGSGFFNGKLTLIAYDSWGGGTFAGYADDSEFSFAGKQWRINYNDSSAGSNFTTDAAGAVGFVTLTAVPELSSIFGVGLTGLFAVGAVWMCRRLGVNPLKI